MRVGINGMGRMGRLALRAAMGGLVRPSDDPRAGNRLEIAHVNEIKGGAEATAHLLADVATGEVPIGGEVHAFATHALPHLFGDQRDGGGHRISVEECGAR